MTDGLAHSDRVGECPIANRSLTLLTATLLQAVRPRAGMLDNPPDSRYSRCRGNAGILGYAADQERKGQTMNDRFGRVLHWTPRILGILFALFISIFALDVFGQGYSFGETIVALIMHLVPTALVVVVLLIAWRWEWAGAVLFAALGAWYLLMTRGRFDWLTYLLISGPLFLIGALFLVSWLRRRTALSSP
jgi:hypothetical protein